MITAILLIILVGLLTKILWVRRKAQQCFKDLGVAGPQPNILLGNQLDLFDGPAKSIRRWTKEYGKTFGYFEGGLIPVLVTSDLEIIKHVFVRDFRHFMGRKPTPFGPDPECKDFNNVFVAHGQMWKRYRSFMSPMFSTNKLKAMQPLVIKALDTLVEIMEEKSKAGEPFDVLPVYQGLTMEVICSTAFGLDMEIQRNPDNEFLVKTKALFEQQNFRTEPLWRKAIILLSFIFPSIGGLLFKLVLYLFMFGIIKFDGFEIGLKLTDIMMERREAKERGEECRQDFLQYMLDAEAEEVDDLNTLTIAHEETDASNPEHGQRTVHGNRPVKKMKKEEIVGNLCLFQNAGFETTSTALAYASYELALHPEVQRRLQDELDEQLGDRPVAYDDLRQLTYLDMVFHEVLRVHPIGVSVVTRYCTEEAAVCGLKIPKGMSVQINVEAIHSDPDVWGPIDPSLFEPERFSKEQRATRHSLAFQAFGSGPRNCVGMRLAQVEGKMALARILQKFTFQICEETEIPLKKVERLTYVPENGVRLRLVPREN